MQSGVFLRNQHRAPVASYDWRPGGSQPALLNASAFSDPEMQPLNFTWKEGSTTLGTGMLLDLSSTPGVHNVTLEVRDVSGLLGQITQAVTIS